MIEYYKCNIMPIEQTVVQVCWMQWTFLMEITVLPYCTKEYLEEEQSG